LPCLFQFSAHFALLRFYRLLGVDATGRGRPGAKTSVFAPYSDAGWQNCRVQSVEVPRKQWFAGLGVLVASVAVGVGFWKEQRPPTPSAARLPASARELLLPFRKDSLDLTVRAHEELNYRVGMQAGATLVYAWSTGNAGDALSSESPGQKTIRAAEAHGAFVAQSSGWYHWRWTNQSGKPIAMHLKLSGYYEEAGMPYDK
jgi:hypothetical protein